MYSTREPSAASVPCHGRGGEVLEKAGAEVEAADGSGQTMLHFAAASGDAAAVKVRSRARSRRC